MDPSVLLILVSALIQGVMCEDWNVTVPSSVVGVEGSCILVPCSFKLPQKFEQDLTSCSRHESIWERGVLHSTVRKNGVLVGDVMASNCTTVFYNFTKEENDIYFFRLDCSSKNLKYSYQNGVRIDVKTGVTPPHLTMVNEVTEGSQVTLQCVAMVPCPILPPSIIWATPRSTTHEQSQILQSSEGQTMLKSTLKFTSSAQHHEQIVTCSASYPQSAGGSTEANLATHILHVLYGPRLTHAELSVMGPVSEGKVVTFTCSSDANPSVANYTWFKFTNGTKVKVGEEHTMHLQVRRAHSGLYLCHAQSEMGDQWSNLLVLEVHSHIKKSFDLSVVLSISCVSGVLCAVCIFTVALLCYKYRRLLRKLKHLEQKEEQIYSDLQTSTITPDYDTLQPRMTDRTSDTCEYENAADLKKNNNPK